MIALIVGAPALTIALMTVAAILIGTREGQPVMARTRLAAWCLYWLALAAVTAMAAGMRRAGGLGLRKLATRIRAARLLRPKAAGAPQRGRHRVVTAR